VADGLSPLERGLYVEPDAGLVEGGLKRLVFVAEADDAREGRLAALLEPGLGRAGPGDEPVADEQAADERRLGHEVVRPEPGADADNRAKGEGCEEV
jgi:hypothetical protein